MREITEHAVNAANEALRIQVTDEPGAGGANHRYEIAGMDLDLNPAADPLRPPYNELIILFQNGPIGEAGVNGITQEVLLAIVADRLRSFQLGSYACRENALALTKIEEAQHWLQSRTRARTARGVEGTHTV